MKAQSINATFRLFKADVGDLRFDAGREGTRTFSSRQFLATDESIG